MTKKLDEVKTRLLTDPKVQAAYDELAPEYDVALPTNRIEALADAWAAIDGMLDNFRAGRGKPISKQPGGHYAGYIADAEAMIKRLEERGFTICRNGPPVS